MPFGRFLVIATVSMVASAHAAVFPNASESNEELIDLWRDADNACRQIKRENVQVAVGCVSRSIYGVALNERGVCLGMNGQANAEMQWHKCTKDSLRFPPFTVPAFQ